MIWNLASTAIAVIAAILAWSIATGRSKP